MIPNITSYLFYLFLGSLFLCLVLYLHSLLCLFCKYFRPSIPDVEPDEARQTIMHENELMNHRLSWLLTSEALLFAALGIALSKDNADLGKQLIPILSFVGIILAASASIVLHTADVAINRYARGRDNVIGYNCWFFGILSPWRVTSQ